MWVLALLNSPPPSFAAWHGQRVRGAALCVASDSEAAASEAAQNILKMPRPTTGEEAFRGTVWQVLFEMDEGGSALFTVEMMSDYKCRFSDKDENGDWNAKDDWIVFEKPNGLFKNTLFMSAQLQPPTPDDPRFKLVNGLVHMAETLDGSDPKDPNRDVKLKKMGTCSGIEEREE